MPPKARPAPATPAQRRAAASETAPPPVTPAPHNGAAYGAAADRRPVRRAEGQKQLSQRIPGELFDRLAACSDQTGVTQRRLLLDALEAELARRGF